ncbi:hypothetical protein BDQ12DRAFT_729113 [Crucibulum laeve]|uniref:Uncharacterized protein n=1 Tax=Crucibulum laeve TaxID=68775 RepID=A0A5C3LGN7_9AGAR|nr:hypothetical protein BDQ12DRAFT_729113 [Crucibulum laeve]
MTGGLPAVASDRAQVGGGAPPSHDGRRTVGGAGHGEARVSEHGSVRGQARGRGRGQTREGGGNGSSGTSGTGQRQLAPLTEEREGAERGPRVELEQRGLSMQQEQRSNKEQRELPRARAFEIALQTANRRQQMGKGKAHPSTSTNGASIDIVVARSKEKAKPPRAAKLAKQAVYYALVLDAGCAVVSILHSRQISYAVFGSLACRLYGDHEEGGKGKGRCPKDVDLLITQEGPAESHFSAADLDTLILSSNPPTHRISYYRSEYLNLESKVDILIPGTILLPPVMKKDVGWLGPVECELNDLHGTGIEGFGLSGLRMAALRPGIPLVPFPVLLLHKLQGRDDRRLAEEKHKRDKMTQDAKDIVRLLVMKSQVEDARWVGWACQGGCSFSGSGWTSEDANTEGQDSPDEWFDPLLFPAPDSPEFMRFF